MLKNVRRDLVAFAVALPRRLFEDRLTQAAGSLTYTSLLSIVPLVTVALAVSTAFPVFDRLVGGLLDYAIENYLPDAPGLDQLADQVSEFTARAAQLTAIGLFILGVTAVMLMLTIDDALNRIFRVKKKRPLLQRLFMYWAVLTLGPMLIGGSISMTTALVASSLGSLDLDWLAELVLRLLPVLLTWAALTSLYILVPNRPVYFPHAVAGGFLAGSVFELAKRGFAIYVSHVPTYTLVYGAFSTLLIFLVWLYLSWLIVLAGATFTAMLSDYRDGRFAEKKEIKDPEKT
jgi:membrane protein